MPRLQPPQAGPHTAGGRDAAALRAEGPDAPRPPRPLTRTPPPQRPLSCGVLPPRVRVLRGCGSDRHLIEIKKLLRPAEVRVVTGGPTAGWYDDNVTTGVVRWFDGTAWTEHTRAVGPPADVVTFAPVAPRPAVAQPQYSPVPTHAPAQQPAPFGAEPSRFDAFGQQP